MKGNTLNEFIESLYYNPEKELMFNGKDYFVSGYITDNNNYTLEVVNITEGCKTIFNYSSTNRDDCVDKFKKAKIFEGTTIFDAEQHIEVIDG